MADIGFIGAGKMGVGVVTNLAKHDNELTVLARSDESLAHQLADLGVTLTQEVTECTAGKDIVFLCLPSMAAWRQVTEIILATASLSTLVIDLTSASPEESRSFHEKAVRNQIGFVDAPMLKGPPAAAKAEIQVLVGGTPENVDQAMPVLEQISEAQFRTGGPGSGHALKLLNNAVTLTNSAIVYETFALAAHLGVDLDMVHRAMDASAASSKRLNAIAPVLKSGNHVPSFDVSTALKDLELYCEMARDAGTLTFSGAGARDLYRLGDMVGLSGEPVTRLADMMLDLMSSTVDRAGRTNSVYKKSSGQ